MKKNLIDMTGQRVGRLTVVQRAPQNDAKGTAMWICICDCGEIRTLRGSVLRNGKTVSCGCYNRDKQISHGGSHTRLYQIWINMRRRCTDHREKDYPRYGGRGITVCDEWCSSFEAFRDWALANGYQESLSLDRSDNNGPYSPENCKWATPQEQANNRRGNVTVTLDGQTHTLAEWERILGIRYGALRDMKADGKDLRLVIELAMTEKEGDE